jgi:CheY-like chemotaxis protein
VINDILDFSKVESGRLDIEEVQFSLSVAIRDVNKMIEVGAQRKNIEYESFVQAEIEQDFKVMGDPGRLRQIIQNLLTNSLKFTTEGHIKLSVTIIAETQDTFNVQFEVEDTGIGIEEDVRKRLFKPFSQADSSTARRFGGTGLGLTISKNLVELMHGEIELESRLGVGTKARFWLPFRKVSEKTDGSPLIELSTIPDRLQSEASISRSAGGGSPPGTPPMRNVNLRGPLSGSSSRAVTAPQSASGITDDYMHLSMAERANIHILVVEDNQINQQIALKTIKKLGFSANAVWNGKESLDYLLEEPTPERPRPNVILMDVQMPIMDGYRATHTIRTQFPFKDNVQDIPIVAMTASAIQGDREKCKKAGMDDYLAKPVKGKVLERMLLKWSIEGRNRTQDSSRQESISADSEYSFEGINEATNKVSSQGSISTEKLTSTSATGSNDTERASSSAQLPLLPTSTIQVPTQPSPSQAPTSAPYQPSQLKHSLSPPSASPPLVSTAGKKSVASFDLASRLSRVQFGSDNALAFGSESDNQRVLRRLQSEEKASSLRDDKMLNLAANSRSHHHDVSEREKAEHREDLGASHPLTRDNLGMLSQQQYASGSSGSGRGGDGSLGGKLLKDRSRSFGDGGDESEGGRRRPGLEGTRKFKSERIERG